jgi:3',5'-nucleoside bisphosphate phosphatase
VIIDLHTHSTASDGTDSPARLVAQAAAAGVHVLGLTDHDTTGGWREAEAALPPGFTLVTGAELSCVWSAGERRVSLHLLGYLFDPDHEGLRAERARLREDRIGRGRAIVERMAADGLPVSWSRVQQLAGGGAVGRPHIGRVLVENGVVDSVDEAFRELLHSASRYYVRKADTDVFTAIALVRAAGGVPVFAHPRARRRGRVVTDEVIVAMAAAGLVGIEIDHPDHSAADRSWLRGLAADLGLVATGASDYHGTNKRTPLAACTTEPDAYAALIDRNTARVPVVLTV